MARMTGASNTQKTVLLALFDGWLLRYVDRHGWCLFQPGRHRPFANLKSRTVDDMTERGWLTPGTTPKGLGFRPAKDLTPTGRRYAEQLNNEDWAFEEWNPPLAQIHPNQDDLEIDGHDDASNDSGFGWLRRAA